MKHSTMRPETVRLATVLLEWHARIRADKKNADTVTPNDLIPYKKLCERAGVPEITRIVGTFLGELASWCSDNRLPPLNSLAVNGEELKPGPGYDNAEGCSEINWWNEVRDCVSADYPPTIP